MLRSCAFVAGVCLSVSGVAQADSPAEKAPLDAAKQAEFNSFVAMGKRAQFGRAIRGSGNGVQSSARHSAPPRHRRGRYGLVLVKLGHLDKAAEELHEAHERGQGVTFARAARGCRGLR
jgi:hypothetical protein